MLAVKSAVCDKIVATVSPLHVIFIILIRRLIPIHRGRFEKPWEWRVYRAALLIAVAHTAFCSIYFADGWLCRGGFHRKRERQRTARSIDNNLVGKLARKTSRAGWKKIETVVSSFPRRLLEDFLCRYKLRLTFASVHHLKSARMSGDPHEVSSRILRGAFSHRDSCE